MSSLRANAVRNVLAGGQWLVRRTGMVLMLLAAFGGWILQRGGPEAAPQRATEQHEDHEGDGFWTCSMHPQIRQPQAGKCPICAMDLIYVDPSLAAGSADSPRLVVPAASAALMNVRTARAERRYVTVQLRMVGKVEYDETKLAHITSWVPGRLDRLYVDYTGVTVEKGDHMVSLYSPELLKAQEELRRTSRAVDALNANSPELLRQTVLTTLESARRKLSLWGLTDAQIRQAEESGDASDHVTIYAPIGGTVVEREGRPGMYVETGSTIYTIADLSEVWVKLDAYESDLPWLHFGQDVVFTTEAYPGEEFVGRVAFIDPILNMKTRTVKVRVNVDNGDRKLKPGMFVRGTVRSEVATGGRIMNPELAGKWISPMHPEIVKEGPGSCDICGMALVSAESLGYVSTHDSETAKPLVIPSTAPLLTGTRAVVYVKDPEAETPTFTGREVELGPKAGDWYIVYDGLEEGEEVVVNGTFKIDSALQILARPSMMNPKTPTPEAPAPAILETPEPFHSQYTTLLDRYDAVRAALAADDGDAAAERARALFEAVTSVNDAGLSPEAKAVWDEAATQLEESARALSQGENLKARREAFEGVSAALTTLAERFGSPDGRMLAVAHCPMAFDRGADWLQFQDGIENPYMGPEMLKCGTVEQVIAPGAHDHEH